VKIRWNLLLNFLLLMAVLLAMAGFQTTFWFQLFGNVPAPMLWLNIIVYVTLYRNPFPGIFIVYAMGFVLLAFTSMPLKMMWLTLLILFTLVQGIRGRVFWSGSGYYTIMCSFSAVAYHIIYFFVSLAIEKNHANFELVDRIVQIILTPSFAFPVYWILAKIDKATNDDYMQAPGGMDL
jgi:hypothetical protein